MCEGMIISPILFVESALLCKQHYLLHTFLLLSGQLKNAKTPTHKYMRGVRDYKIQLVLAIVADAHGCFFTLIGADFFRHFANDERRNYQYGKEPAICPKSDGHEGENDAECNGKI